MAKVYLRLLEPTGALVPCPVSFIGSSGVWAFPLGLQSYGEERLARVQVLHIPDGVAADSLGISPPVFQLEATFGSKPKMVRGRTMSAQEVTNDLIAFVQFYFSERRQRVRERNDLIEMALDDFVHARHWIVQPDGAPKVRHAAREPVRTYWSMTLQGLRRWQSTTTPLDALASALVPGTSAQIGREWDRFDAFAGET
jgi:hypothetical protein